MPADDTMLEDQPVLAGEQNPFLRYRERLDAYEVVRDGRLSDERFVEIVGQLDAAIETAWGAGFRITPLLDGTKLAAAAGLDVPLSIKVEAGNVGGSHKARHLMGVMIHRLVAEALDGPTQRSLAIASCGNAALGAAVVAKATNRTLDVFVPTWADEAVVEQLAKFDARINRCERLDGELGDPCYRRFREAVDAGAEPFSVQGSDTPTTFDGARTLGWEIGEQTANHRWGPVAALYVQVGGGALATAVSQALPEARVYPVQAEGCAPLRRAWDLLAPTFDFAEAARNPDDYMQPWADPHSFATGILDDITYDWLPLLDRTHATGGHPVVAQEATVVEAYNLAHAHTSVPVCSTGTAGFAGLLSEPPSSDEHTVVLFTGIDRT